MNTQSQSMKCRRPQFEIHYTDSAAALWRTKKEIDVCRPLSKMNGSPSIDWAQPQNENRTWRLYFYSCCWIFVWIRNIDYPVADTERDEGIALVRWALSRLCSFLFETSSDELEVLGAVDDHALAWRVSFLSYLLCREDILIVSSDLRGRIEHLVIESVRILRGHLESENWRGNNHTIFHAEAVFDARIALPGRGEISPAIESAKAALVTLYGELFDCEEGAANEQSAYYHVFNMDLLVQHANYLKRCQISDVAVFPRLDKMYEFLELIAGNSVWLPPIGDTSIRSPISLSAVRERLGLVEEASRCGPERIRSLPRTGYHILRAKGGELDETTVIYITKERRIHHGHFDGGSYLLCRHGKWIISDSGGPFAYGKPPRFEHFMRPSAHNCLIIDNSNENGISELSGVSNEAVWVSSTSSCAGKSWHRRWVHLAANGTLIVIDKIRKSGAGNARILVHLDVDAIPSIGGESKAMIQLDRFSTHCSFQTSTTGQLRVFLPDDAHPASRSTRKHEDIQFSGLIEYEIEGDDVTSCHVLCANHPVDISLESSQDCTIISVSEANYLCKIYLTGYEYESTISRIENCSGV